jgi:WD40 repeat protein
VPLCGLFSAACRWQTSNAFSATHHPRCRPSICFANDAERYWAELRRQCHGNGDWNQRGHVKLWDVATWRERRTLQHTGEVLCLAFAPDGKTLAAGSCDKTIRLWEMEFTDKPFR